MLLWILVLFMIGVLVALIVLYNRLVGARNAYKNAFAQIDVQLTRRYELIPNLVEVAKRYMAHEKDTLEAVIVARNQAAGSLRQAAGDPGNARALEQLAQAEQGLSGVLGRLFALSESYPELLANEILMQLSEELVSTENRVAFARQAFNDAVMSYNNMREMFPGNLIAGAFGFHPAQLLKIESEHMRSAVKVSF